MAHLDQDLAEHFHRSHGRRRTEAMPLVSDTGGRLVGQADEVGRHDRQEPVAQLGEQRLGQYAGIAPGVHGGRSTGERPTGIGVDQRFEQVVERLGVGRHTAGRDHLLEGRDGVARRTATEADDRFDGGIVHREPGVGRQPAHVRFQRVGRQEAEVQLLRTAADGLGHLLRIGGGEHEHDVRRRFLEGLQEGGFGRLREHVDLVEDVHLVASGGAERGLLDEVTHGVDAVVRGGVELVHVVAGAGLDRLAAVAHAAWFAVDRVGAVEHLGQDAGAGGLARAAGTGEQVGVADTVVADGVAQGLDHVLLPAHLGEAARTVTAVERLVGHGPEPTDGVPRGAEGETGRHETLWGGRCRRHVNCPGLKTHTSPIRDSFEPSRPEPAGPGRACSGETRPDGFGVE